MGALGIRVRDGQLAKLEEWRCALCRRLLGRLDPDAMKPGKVLEVKCECNALQYKFGGST